MLAVSVKIDFEKVVLLSVCFSYGVLSLNSDDRTGTVVLVCELMNMNLYEFIKGMHMFFFTFCEYI